MEKIKVCEDCPHLKGVAGCFYIAGKITERCPRVIEAYEKFRQKDEVEDET